jgi:GPH family glycoside/pentoside/hexuronide:cation symporter
VKLSVGVMMAYGMGDIAQAIKNQGFNVLLLFFYQQLIGLPGTLTGLALAIAAIPLAVSFFRCRNVP